MAAEENLPYGRSPSRASRSAYGVTLEQRSFFGPKNSKKAQQKSATDKLVWFSPVHSPLLSPAREKTLQLSKKKVRSSSIFSIQNRAKGSIETEEPTSPKVSCIGQVRACKKDKDPIAEANKKKTSLAKPGSISPARFFSSPGRARKWGSLFGSRKETCATLSSAGYGEGEVSCFDSPFGSHSMYQSDTTGAFLAESLTVPKESGNLRESSYGDVIQACTHAADYELSYDKKVTQLHTHAADYEPCYDKAMQSCTNGADGELEEQDPWAVGYGFSDRYTHDVTDSRVFGDARPFTVDSPHLSQKEGDSRSREIDKNGKRPILDAATNHETSVQERQHCHGKPLPSNKQKLTYEELPSLHCGTSVKPDMKISVEVVPETWLWRSRVKVRPVTTSQQSCIAETSTGAGTSGQYLQRVQEEDIATSNSPCTNSQHHSQEGEGCTDFQMPQHADMVDKADSVPEVADLDPVDNVICKPVHLDSERQNEPSCMPMDGGSPVHSILSSACPAMGACKEESREVTHSGGDDRPNGAQVDKHRALHCEKMKDEVDVEKHKMSVGFSESKNRHRRQRRIGPDVGKENYGIVLPQLVENKLPSVHANKEKRQWNAFKGRKSDAFSAQPFSALILVGYEQAMASKDNIQKGTHSEEFFKGVLEVGRLSFHNSAKYFQVLKSDAEFIRSRSATSHRTVITLQRCNSDPCRSSY